MSAQVNGRTKEALSKATLYSTLAALKGFFQWLAGQRGYKSKFTYSDAEYFNLGRGDKAHREQIVPTLWLHHRLGAAEAKQRRGDGDDEWKRTRSVPRRSKVLQVAARMERNGIVCLDGALSHWSRGVRPCSSKTYERDDARGNT